MQVLFNETWDRVHSLAGGLDGPLKKLERDTRPAVDVGRRRRSRRALAFLALGEPREALEHARAATERSREPGASKFAWRSRLAAAEALLELGRASEAAAELPGMSPGNELQDIVYDTATRVGIALALGRVEEAVELGRGAAAHDETS